MKALPYIFGAVVVLSLVWMLGRWSSAVKFEQEQIDTKPSSVLADRRTVDLTATSKEGVLSVVGLVLIADDAHDGSTPRTFDSTKAIIQFRPPREKILVDPLNTVLYQGKVSKQFSLGGSYTGFTTQLADDQLAEVTVKDEMFVGYKERNDIPIAGLRLIRPAPGKTYFFVESATVTSVAHKKFRKSSSKSQFSGTVFGADGSVFVSTEESVFDTKLSVTAWDISLFQPGAGGADPTGREGLIQKQVGGTIGTDEAKRLVNILRDESKEKTKLLSSAAIKVDDTPRK